MENFLNCKLKPQPEISQAMPPSQFRRTSTHSLQTDQKYFVRCYLEAQVLTIAATVVKLISIVMGSVDFILDKTIYCVLHSDFAV